MSDNDYDIQAMANEGTPGSRHDSSSDGFSPVDALADLRRNWAMLYKNKNKNSF